MTSPTHMPACRKTSDRQRAAAIHLVTQSELEGNCRGWDGDTVFKLSNGEVWKQSAFRARKLHLCCPAVRVWRRGMVFLLEVEAAKEVLPVQPWPSRG